MKRIFLCAPIILLFACVHNKSVPSLNKLSSVNDVKYKLVTVTSVRKNRNLLKPTVCTVYFYTEESQWIVLNTGWCPSSRHKINGNFLALVGFRKNKIVFYSTDSSDIAWYKNFIKPKEG